MRKNSNSIIIHVLMGSGRGGIELQLRTLIEIMHSHIMQVYVAHNNTQFNNCVFKDTNITVDKGSSNGIRCVYQMYNYARQNRHCIFHGYNLGPVYLLVLWLAGVSRVVYSIRGTIYWKTRLQKLMLRPLWTLALVKKPVFISNSDYSARVFKETVNSKVTITTVYNPVYSKSVESSALELEPVTTLKIIYAGRLVNGKNLFKWLETTKHILKHFPHARFSLYGQGPLLAQLMNYAAELQIDQFVEFKGFEDDMGMVYNKADVLLFLSCYESFGNVVVESILAGTPVLCSDIPSMQEIFRDYQEFIIPLNDKFYDTVIEKIKQLDQLKELAEKARPVFQKRYSMERYMSELDKVYDSI